MQTQLSGMLVVRWRGVWQLMAILTLLGALIPTAVSGR